MRLATSIALALAGSLGVGAKPIAKSFAHVASVGVQIQNGTVNGIELPTFGQHFFGGIPYAAPPTRFEPSKPLQQRFPDKGFNASTYSDACWGSGDAGDVKMSEDCLSINIIRPETASSGSGLPVVLWLHGGGFYAGSSAQSSLNGSWIVQESVDMGKPIIFTSINYRLLVLGFPSGDEAHKAGIENLGLLDQRLAMQWIHENIAAFGGDPKKLTIMGESAGGTAILQHLVAYGGAEQHLFRAAIVESGSFYQVNCTHNVTEQREANWNALLAASNCTDLACLKTAPSLPEIAISFWDTFLPSIDGKLIEEHPVQLWAEKHFVNVPLLMGVNADEGTVLGTPGCNTEADIIAGVTSLNECSYVVFPDAFDSLFAAYPDDPSIGIPLNTGDGLLSSGTMDKRMNSIFNDAIEHAPRRWITSLMAEAGNPTFSYHFHQVPYNGSISIGATHATEIPYVFSNPDTIGPRERDNSLGRFMTRSWVSFIHSLSPAHTGICDAPRWPAYSKKDPRNMVFSSHGSYIETDDYRTDGIALLTEQRIKGCWSLAPKHQQ
ncbi:hypothetical protein Rhopal_001154-T1 [Rhodotorula paludigena]|uniref:Carboxylic ester hydrolase n=1 Tax=Rhodotorula paludigena TaxID=86838 RepID=A0AAV5GFS2_9BASI|nr:hypothetical protein Rhopal_001154-T1 [Rhodotorula paludigena]